MICMPYGSFILFESRLTIPELVMFLFMNKECSDVHYKWFRKISLLRYGS